MSNKYAVIEGGVVRNVVLADKALESNWVLAPATVKKGDTYDGSTFTSKPATPPKEARIITVGAFRRRLTLNEKVALETSTDPVVRVLEKDLSTSSHVDLDLQDLIDGLNYLADNVPPFDAARVAELRRDAVATEKP